MSASPSIFISYASEDASRVVRIAEILASRDVAVWFDRREMNPGDDLIARIEAALRQATTVLVLWSRAAAGSTWVQRERNAALARSYAGEPVRVLFGLFDDTPVPPLSASELHVDLRDHQTWEERLSILSTQIRTAPSSDILDRIHRMEIPRPVLLEQVTQHACNGTPVVVLAPRKGGVTSFTRHLHAHIARIYPTWDVRPVPAVALTGESKTEYIARLGRLMGIHEPGDRLVVCVHGWSACPPSFREALGAELRALLEGGRELLRPFSLVALGGHALFLLRFTGALSCLNSAEQMDLPDFTVNEIHELMERLSPGCWSLADAGEVWRRTGGHPYLTKAMLIHWVKVRRWDAADEALDDDHTFLLYRLTEAFRDERRLRVLRSLLNRPEGVRYSVFDPEHASLQLYYDGLLRRDQRYLTFRCPAVRRLVESWPTQEQAQ